MKQISGTGRGSRLRAESAVEHDTDARPRLGILAFGPIQYHTPLYQLLAKRHQVCLDVLYLSDRGFRSTMDPGFGQVVAWDIDLLSGYDHQFLAAVDHPRITPGRLRLLSHWVTSHDAIVVNGYTNPWMLLAMAICRLRNIPYLLRGSSHPEGSSTGLYRHLRRVATRIVVSGAAGGLAMGRLNEDFYRQNGARQVTFAPNSVDNERFAGQPSISRTDLLARWGLPNDLPLIMFSGKLVPRKRPLDLVAALSVLPDEVSAIFVGDGSLAAHLRSLLSPGRGVVSGFINQVDLPAYYHAADILVLPSEKEAWGLVVNEAMAAGTLPVVSDRVGCARDLASSAGEVFRFGDVPDLARALARALARTADPATADQVRQHVAGYSLARTAAGFEEATLAITARPSLQAAQSSLDTAKEA